MQPIYIGIVGKHINSSKISYTTSSMIRDEITTALTYFGALPIGIPLPCSYPNHDTDVYHHLHTTFTRKERTIIDSYLNLCRGLIFQGGNHIDHYEYELARIAHQHNLPTLGFCSGQFVMTSALLPDQLEITKVDPKLHHQPNNPHAHLIQVIPKTQFSQIVQDTGFFVNSRHRTCISRILPNPTALQISALSPEGFPEVIEDPTKKFTSLPAFIPKATFTINSCLASSRLLSPCANLQCRFPRHFLMLYHIQTKNKLTLKS